MYSVSVARITYSKVSPTVNDVDEPTLSWFVVHSSAPRTPVCKCWSQTDAQMVADALNES